MKGGYQTIDLSTANTSGAVEINGALEAFKNSNGKAILIKTPSGNSVFGKVTEGTLGTYSASYIDGENIVKVTVDEDSNVIIENLGSTDTGDLETRISAIENQVIKKQTLDYANAVDLTPYNAFANNYTVTGDGYLIGTCPQGSTSNYVGFGNSEGGSIGTIQGISGRPANLCVFVRKGMKVCAHINDGTGNTVRYVPLKEG